VIATSSTSSGRILVVDDNQLNRSVLTRSLQKEGYAVETAENGLLAFELLRQPPSFDVVLLDILMPELDGYETLARIKSDDAIKHIPVIMITAVDELESVIRCIEMGATDYLHKPFNGPILQARISASLATKRLRDLELEYLEQVGHVTAAAGAVETATFDLTNLNEVAERSDALGQLARVFQRMAREVRAREERLEQTVRELRIEIDEARQAKKVAEITESEYFQRLRGEADSLRKIMGDARNTEK
jgi:two-component system cell cycle response regulator